MINPNDARESNLSSCNLITAQFLLHITQILDNTIRHKNCNGGSFQNLGWHFPSPIISFPIVRNNNTTSKQCSIDNKRILQRKFEIIELRFQFHRLISRNKAESRSLFKNSLDTTKIDQLYICFRTNQNTKCGSFH